MLSAEKIVEDWGGFEDLVTKLHETGNVTVKHNVKLRGESGALRQIDVLITHTEGLYEHLILVECKHWKSNVKRLQVDAMATAVKDLKASKGVIFTTKDFQSGAVTAAQAFGVDLIKVREFADSEWGRPGRHIDFFMHYFQRSIGNLKVEASALGIPGEQIPPIHLDNRIGDEETGAGSSTTPTIKPDGTPGETLEKIISDKSAEGLAQVVNSNNFATGDQDGAEGYYATNLNIEAPNKIVVWVGSRTVFITRISLLLAVKIYQSRFQLDRKAKYLFALAVENKVTGHVTAATREKEAEHTRLDRLVPQEASDEEPVMENGSTLKITLKGFFPFEDYVKATTQGAQLIATHDGSPEADEPSSNGRNGDSEA